MITRNTIWLWMVPGVSVAAAEPAKSGPPAQMPAPPAGPVPPGGGDAPQMTDIHDIKPILDMGHDWQWLIYLVGGLVIAAGLLWLAWWLWKRRRRPEEALPPTPPPPPPEVEAYNALEALAAESGLDPKQFYFRLSAVLRRYVERRFLFPAAEMTTEELLPAVDRLSLDSSLAMEFKAFCRKTDPIKFAGAAVQQDRLARDLAFSRDFVRQTTDVIDTQQEKKTP